MATINLDYYNILDSTFDNGHKNRSLEINNDFVVAVVAKVACSTVVIQNLCYKNKENIDKYNEGRYKHINYIGFGDLHEYANMKYALDIARVKNKIKIAIFRDPVDRLKSFYLGGPKYAWDKQLSFSEVVKKVQRTFNEFDLNLIDPHVNLQSNYYDFDDIDLFIDIKDYSKFCEENHIDMIPMNQKTVSDDIEITENDRRIIEKIYEKDYELISKILSSNKLYEPNKQKRP